MEVISSWSPDAVSAYLQGLESSVQHYPFHEWGIGGQELLDLSPQHLESLGVRSIGHQEVILEAVEQLCALHYDPYRESLRSLTDKLHRAAQVLHFQLTTLKSASVSQSSSLSTSHKQLTCIIDIVSAARALFSWLNRYLFTRLNDYSASRDVIALCTELAEMLHKDWTDSKVEARILTVCDNICGICSSILTYSPESLLSQTATLEPVQIYAEPSCSLGLEVKSTSSGQHFICQTAPESPARRCENILPGDEIIQVNDHVVLFFSIPVSSQVGWTHKNLVCKLQEKSNGVTLVLKKVTVPSSRSLASQRKKKTNETFTSPSTSSLSCSLARNIFGSTKENQTAKEHVFALKSNSFPNSVEIHRQVLEIQCAPTSLIEKKLLNATLFRKTSSSENYSESKNPLRASTSQGHNTWPHSETPSHSRSNALANFTSLFAVSLELPAQPEMISSNIFAKALTPVIQSSSDIEPQELKDASRPRSGSDSTSSPADSASVPLSAALRPSTSDSNLLKIKDPDSRPSKTLEASSQNVQKILSSESPNIKKKLNVSQTDSSSLCGKEVSVRSLRNQKATKLSRRRVSCRDLGSPDCDGWLMQKKENVSFMSQRWKRCWCVLKKDKLYWYNGPQDEKALGLLNISAYNLESPLEAKHKKKYEFQLTHHTYKPFVFAAENLTDMKKWVTCLVKTLQKYKAQSNSNPSREEDCYSETEAEDDEQYKAQEVVKKPMIMVKSTSGESPVSPRKKVIEGGASPVSPREKRIDGLQPKDCSSTQSQANDDLHLMMNCLKQGGVSLIGKKTVMTRDEYRKSFARRNKNPVINHKAHALRVLQSTLKAKLQELEALNQILEHSNLDSDTFQKWKSEHEQLYGTIGAYQAERNVYGMDIDGRTDKSKESSDESETSD